MFLQQSAIRGGGGGVAGEMFRPIYRCILDMIRDGRVNPYSAGIDFKRHRHL